MGCWPTFITAEGYARVNVGFQGGASGAHVSGFYNLGHQSPTGSFTTSILSGSEETRGTLLVVFASTGHGARTIAGVRINGVLVNVQVADEIPGQFIDIEGAGGNDDVEPLTTDTDTCPCSIVDAGGRVIAQARAFWTSANIGRVLVLEVRYINSALNIAAFFGTPLPPAPTGVSITASTATLGAYVSDAEGRHNNVVYKEPIGDVEFTFEVDTNLPTNRTISSITINDQTVTLSPGVQTITINGRPAATLNVVRNARGNEVRVRISNIAQSLDIVGHV